jgi:hypothetical protein
MEKEEKKAFDLDKLFDLKQAYKKAIQEEKDTFWFDDKQLLVSYAKYLIEYLEYQLKP